MILTGAQTVYPCKEHEPVQIPIQKLLGSDGRLEIYPEVTGKGYFDIDYKDGRLVLKSTRYIGLIPISDDIAIHVQPRTPISNLMRMIERSGVTLAGVQDFVRGYQEELGALDTPEEVYVTTFVTALKRMTKVGILKRYVRRQTDRELRGRLLMGETIGRFRSKGINYRTAFEVHDLTADNDENRIIKHTAERLLRYFIAKPTTQTHDLTQQLTRMLLPFGSVNGDIIDAEFVARAAPNLIRGLPRSHRFYEPMLWLSYLISTNSGISMEQIGRARFETVILDAASIFEGYIRRLIEDAAGANLGGCRVFDGNVQNVKLFINNPAVTTKPDYYFKRGNVAVALADAKYKPMVSSADRYELLAFCEASNVRKAAFICPKLDGRADMVLHGTTASGREVHIVTINLAGDLEAEEVRFVRCLCETLGLIVPVV